MENIVFKIHHKCDTQIKYLLIIIEDKDLSLKKELKEINFPFTLNFEEKLNFIKLLFQKRGQQNIINEDQLTNFISILIFKLYLALTKKKNQNVSQKLKQSGRHFFIQDYRSVTAQRSELMKEVKTKITELLQVQMKGGLLTKIKDIGQDFHYTLMLAAYYYLLKQRFVQDNQFKSIEKIQVQLKKIRQIYHQFYIDFSKELRYFTKKQRQLKYIIDKQTNSQIIQLLSSDYPERTKICLSHIVRNIIRNGFQEFDLQKLYEISQNITNKQIKGPIYQSIIFCQHLKKGKQFIDKIIQKNEDLQFNNYLIQRKIFHNIGRIQKKQYKYLPKKSNNSMRNVENYSFRNKLKQKNIVTIQQEGLSQQLQAKISKGSIQANEKEVIFDHPNFILQVEAEGSDIPTIGGTFVSVKNLFQKAQKDGKIRKKDKDYLQQKFINKGKKRICKGLFGQLIIDVMIARIYQIISKKQVIKDQAIQNLINRCILNQSTFQKQYIDQLNSKTLLEQFQKNIQQYQQQYQFIVKENQQAYSKKITQLTKQIKNKLIDKNKKWLCVKKLIDSIRVHSIATIYNSFCIQKKKDFQKIQSFLFRRIIKQLDKYQTCQFESEYFKYLLNLCMFRQNYFERDEKGPNLLFNACISELSNTKCKQLCLKYLKKKSQEIKYHEIIFQGQQIQRLVKHMISEQDKWSLTKLFSIITHYLLNIKLQPIKLDSLQLFRNHKHFKEFKMQFYKVYFLNTKKQRLIYPIDDNLIKKFIEKYKEYQQSTEEQDQNIIYVVLLVIFNFSNKKAVPQLDLFTPMLKKNIGVSFQRQQLIFNRQNSSKQNAIISQFAANIILNSLMHNGFQQQIILQPILKSIKTCNYATKVLLGNLLQNYSAKKVLPHIHLVQLQQHLDQQIFEVKYKLIKTCLNILKKIQPQQFNPSYLLQILIFQKINLNGEQISQKTNRQILKLLSQYIKVSDFKQFTSAKTFSILVFFLSNNSFQDIMTSIQILITYSLKFFIPKDVLQVLDNLVERKIFQPNEMEQIRTNKQIIYNNLIKNEYQVTLQQANLWVEKLLSCQDFQKGTIYFKKLDKINMNQDLPQQIFNTIYIQRCCMRYQYQNSQIKIRIQQIILSMTSKGIPLNYLLNFSIMRTNLDQQQINIIKIIHNLSFNQKISMDLITALLTIYKPTREDKNYEKQKLIAQIIVNTYLDYQMNQILNQAILFRSVDNAQILSIALPIILKQNFEQKHESRMDSLDKIIKFYKQTKDIRRKQLISSLFINENVVQNIINQCEHYVQSLFLPQQNFTPKLKQNCLRALQKLSEKGYKQAIRYLKKNQQIQNSIIKKRKQIQQIRLIKFESLKKKTLQQCIKYEQRQQLSQLSLISQQIKKIIKINIEVDNNTKRDYLYNKFDLQTVIHQFQKLHQQQMTNNILEYYKQVIIMISSINQNHVYEQILINNQKFVFLIQKLINQNHYQLQLLQIYVKIIQYRKCQSFKQVFHNILNILKYSHPQQILFNLLIIIQKSIAHYNTQVFSQISKQQSKQIIIQTLQNYSNSSLENIRYVSIKSLKNMKNYLDYTTQKLQNLSNAVFQKCFYLFSTETINVNLQILCIFQKGIVNTLSSQNQQKIVYNMILKQFLYKLSNDDTKRIKMSVLWNKNIQLIESIEERTNLLKELYLNCQRQVGFKNIYQFLEFFIFNTSFSQSRMLLTNNIKNHKFKEEKLVKMLVHHYLLHLQRKLQIEPQKLINICFNEEIKDINNFFNQILLLQKQQTIKIIDRIYQKQIYLHQIFENTEKITFNHIQSLQIFKQIMILTNQGGYNKKNQLQQLIVINLNKYECTQLKELVNASKQFGSLNMDSYIQIFELISHFKTDRTKYLTQIVNQSITQCAKDYNLFIKILNSKFIAKICPQKKDREVQQCVNKITFYPENNYKNNQILDYFKYSLNYIKTKKCYQSSFRNLKLFNKDKQLTLWKDEDYKDWSALVKKNIEYTSNRQFYKEALLIIKTAIYNGTSNKTFRNNQLISCLMMLNNYKLAKQNIKGKLLQISTGQGKSTIICAVAIILALKGDQVDIITTTSILAQRDVKQFEKIYHKFGLTVADNIDREPYLNGVKKCYNCNVVYGQISQFQFDYLRDIYNQYETLGPQGKKRQKKCVLVDEVDSMLIDDSSKIAKISSNVLGIEKLQIVYVIIWQKLLKIRQNILEFNDKYYYFDGRLQQIKGQLSFFYHKESSQINQKQQKIEDLNKYMNKVNTNLQKLIDKIILMKTNSRQTIKQLLMKVQKLFQQDKNGKSKYHIPSNFKQFVKIQFPRWVQSAMQAQQYQQNIDYVIENQSISPVDYDNTGKVQHSTHWANGLHQFLQLKHFLKLTPQNLTTNFISNIQYFQLYENLIGVTGTIGSKKCKQILYQTYKVEIIIIPDSFDKKLVQYPSKMLQNTEQWSKQIILSTQYELKKDRGILIICETIQYCNYIYSKLKEKNHNQIKLYTMNDKDQEKNIEKCIDKKQIIIATNLAGRGTDIKTVLIEPYGGLHVILTFLPKNLRVQYQAKGRTARNGNFGSCQLIINKLLMPRQYQNSVSYLQLRDSLQQKKLDQFFKKQKKNIQIKDSLFLEFCSFLKEMKKKLQNKIQQVKSLKSKLSEQIKVRESNKKKDRPILQNNILAIQQKWAFFLNSHEFDQSFQKSIFDQFKKDIEQKIDEKDNNDNLIKNPYCLSLNGYKFFISKFQITNMIKYYTNEYVLFGINNFILSIKQDKKIVSSWTGLGQIALYLQDKEILQKCSKKLERKFINYKQLAIYCYTQASLLLKNEISVIEIVQKYSIMDSTQRKSLFNQTCSKYQILVQYLNNVTSIINEIKKSKKLITINKILQRQQLLHHVSFPQIQRKEDLINQIQEIYKQHKTDIRFHHLNSNQNDQSPKILKQLTTLINQKQNQYKEIDFLNLQFKDLNEKEINLLLLSRKYRKNLNYQNSKKFINSQEKDKKNTSYIIQSIQQKCSVKKLNKKESIGYLESQKQKDHHYTIIINSQSQIQQYLKICKLTIKCENMNYQNVKQILEQIECQSYIIQVLLDINNQQIKQYLAKFITQENDLTLFIEKDLRKDLELHGLDNIKLETIRVQYTKTNSQKYDVKKIHKIIFKINNKEQAKIVCQKLQDQLFNITFNHYTKALFINAKDIKFNLLLHSFNLPTPKEKISKIISLLGKIKSNKSKYNFDLIIKQIDKTKIMKLINIHLDQEDILIRGRKEICQLFPKATAPYTQIYQYMFQGIQYLLFIQQQKKLPVSTLIALGSIAFLQIVAGTLLTSSGIGAFIGLPLIIESIADIISLGVAIKTRQFSWKFYVLTKIASLGSAIGINYYLRWITSLNVVGGLSLGASLASVSKLSGIRTLSLMHIQIMNHIKNNSQHLIRQEKNNGQINREDFQYRKLINQIIFNKIFQYFKQKKTFKAIINKMVMLDNVDQSSLWEKKIHRNIKQIVHSQQLQECLQRLVKKISRKMKSEEKNNFLISLQNNKHLNTIVIKNCKQTQIKIYQIEETMLGLNSIFKKYSRISCQQYANNFLRFQMKRQKIVCGEREKEFKYQPFDLNILKQMRKIDKQNTFLINCENTSQRINRQTDQNSINNFNKILSQNISNLMINKLIQLMANPIFQENQIFSLKNIRQTLIDPSEQSFIYRQSYQDSIIMRTNQKLQQILIKDQSKQIQIQTALIQYSQLILVKQATPVDILMLFQQLDLKEKLVNNQSSQGSIIQKGYLAYKRMTNGEYQYQQNQKQITNNQHSGFKQIAQLKNIKIQVLRNLYSNLVLKEKKKFRNYLKSYWQLYGNNFQQIQPQNNFVKNKLQKNYYGFKHIISNFKECSILKQIQKVQKCISNHILLQTQNSGEEIIQNAYFTIEFKQKYRAQLQNLIQFIIKYKVKGSYINEGLKTPIIQENREKIVKYNQIQVKFRLNRKDQVK